MTLIVGIDPGLKGGLCTLEYGKILDLSPMPVRKNEVDHENEVDYEKVRDYLERRRPHLVIIERQIVIVGQNLAASAKTMYSFGAVVGVLIALRIPYEIVSARTWQDIYKNDALADTSAWKYSKETKQRSVGIALYLYPDAPLLPTNRCTKPSDGLAEALLLAVYGYRSMI